MTLFTDWCTKNSIDIDSRLEVRTNDTVSVYSSDGEILPGETLVKIPRNAVLSSRNCSVSEHLSHNPYGRSAQLSLALALHVELDKGASSKWHGYLQSLPTTVDLPFFWTDGSSSDSATAVQWLRGTVVEKLLNATENGLTVKDELNKYFAEAAKPVYMSHFSVEPSFERFCHAYSLVSSRAFLVDSYHGLAMVPVADAFDHSYDNHVHLESEFDVCPECASVEECPHDAENHSERNVSRDQSSIFEDHYEVVSNAPIPPQCRVFNTYGETLSNAELLVQYGFILDENQNDCVLFDEKELQAVCPPHVQDALPQDVSIDSLERSELISTSDRNGLFVDSDGAIAQQVWIRLVLAHTDDQSTNLDQLIDQVFDAQVYYEHLVESGGSGPRPSSANKDLLLETATAILSLCQERKKVLRDDATHALDTLSPELKRTRLAILQTITERSILETCESSWGEIVAILVQGDN